MRNKVLWTVVATAATIGLTSTQADAAVVARDAQLPGPEGTRSYEIRIPNLFGDGTSVGLRTRTLSYGGGETWESPISAGGDPIRNAVSAGGFDPIFTLKSSSGAVIDQVDDSGLLGNRPDPNTGRTFDAAADLRVAPGTYSLEVTQYDNFGDGLERIEGFKDVTDADRANRFTAQVHTISDYLSNSVRTEVTGPTIRAYFEPKTEGLFNNISEIAEFGGFDHFNWLNVLESRNFRAMNPFRGPSVGGPDPAIGGNGGSGPDDNFIWYYDEPAGRFNWIGAYENDGTRLRFQDRPSSAFPGGELVFKTYLAGVRAGDDGVVFAGVNRQAFQNLSFRWRYTEENFVGPGDRVDVLANPELLGDSNGEIEFLGFLQPEDWTQEEISNLQSLGVSIAGLEGGLVSIGTPDSTPETPDSNPETPTEIPEPVSILGLLAFGAVATTQLGKSKEKHSITD